MARGEVVYEIMKTIVMSIFIVIVMMTLIHSVAKAY